MGAFDDLIPKRGKQRPQAASGTFADLVPSAQFDGVQSNIDSTEDRSGGYRGPLLAPSRYADINAPALSQINAANRAAVASPQFAQQRAAADASQMQAKQRMYRDLPAPVRGLVGMGKAAGNAVMGLGQIVGLTDEGDAEALRQRDAYLEGDAATSLGNIGGQVAMAAIPLSRVGSLGRAGQYAASIGTGAAMGALEPTVEGESRLQNTLVGGALGGVGQGASSAVSAYGRRAATAIAPEVRQLANRAAELGIRVTPAQLSSSVPLKAIRSTVGRLPFSGAQKVGQQQVEQFNRAVARTFGEDAPAVNQALYAKAKARIGGEFNRLSERNAVNVDDQLLGDLVTVQQEAAQFGADDTVKAVNSAIEKAISRSENGAIAGRAYQSMDSQLGKLMKSGGEKAHYIGQVRDALRSGMDRSVSESDQAAWQLARNQYRNLKTVRDLVAKETTEGISPAALMGRLNSTGAGRESMASMGGGDLADLARIGQRFLKDPIPNSGTAERLSVLGLLGGGGAAFGVGPAALATGIGGGAATRGLLDSPALARYMLSSGRGQGAQLLAPYLRSAFVPATGLLSEQGADDPRKGP